jgi:4-hydroxy-tetrahydrodipicolinate synthase
MAMYKWSMPGVLAPVLTPFGEDLAPDQAAFVAFCRSLLDQGLGLAPFGTTGEGPSLAVEEKIALLDALAAAGVDMGRVLPGTGACALTDTVRLSAHATRLGCGGVLMLPPFYFKDVSDDGLFRSYAEIIERVGDARLRVMLYHFPRHSCTPLSLALVERLVRRYPGTVIGLKDSSGDFSNMAALCQALPGFAVYTGSESLLLPLLKAGGAGCITSHANLNGPAMLELCRNWRGEGAEALQSALLRFRDGWAGVPLIAALKAAVAEATGQASWRRVRPPLVELAPELWPDLRARLDGARG